MKVIREHRNRVNLAAAAALCTCKATNDQRVEAARWSQEKATLDGALSDFD
ncbi:MAG: hypothetical protein AAGN46_01895 [Acidobacteriota bacterium]